MAKSTGKKTEGEVLTDTPPQSLTTIQQGIDAQKDAAFEARVAALDGAPSASPKEKTDATPEPSDEDAYKTWYEAQPEKFREQFAKNVVSHVDADLQTRWGPELTTLMRELDKPENSDLKKKIARLTDSQFRQFTLDYAAGLYDDPRYAQPAAKDGEKEPEATDPRVDALEKRLNDREQSEALARYQGERVTEYQALLAKYPELQWQTQDEPSAKKVKWVLEEAERRSAKANKKISYAEVYDDLAKMLDEQRENPAPRAIPSTSKTEIPKPQAPRTAVETRQAIKGSLDKYGSLTQLAAALAK